MTTAYHSQNRPQRNRRILLQRLRDELGDRRFGDFIIDVMSENGASSWVDNFPAMVEPWIKKQNFP